MPLTALLLASVCLLFSFILACSLLFLGLRYPTQYPTCMGYPHGGIGMASYTVEKRKTAAGAIRYRCIVRVKKDSKVVYQKSRTFGRLADARSWRRQLTSQIEVSGVPGQMVEILTVWECIRTILTSAKKQGGLNATR